MTRDPARDALPAGIAILGPTGSGKSQLAMQVASARPVEIISVDSAQVYRGLDVGTAKPSAAERSAVPHHLIDIREPEQVYSAGEFRSDCLALIHDIAARGRVPLLVGGTMLYYRALFRGIAELPADEAVRARIDARAAQLGWPALHAELAARDPASAARIHANDAQRIQRALEVLSVSGRTLGEHWETGSRDATPFGNWTICVLEPADRAVLHRAIEQRLAAMVEAGFVQEIRNLLARGTLAADAPVMRLVGYRQLADYCRGEKSLQEALSYALSATRQLAKRQLTWLRSGKLLPDGANVIRGDPFDSSQTQLMRQALIKAPQAPC
jgi:tRNA dimethylallyltransferase